jgi:hypothetical protein
VALRALAAKAALSASAPATGSVGPNLELNFEPDCACWAALQIRIAAGARPVESAANSRRNSLVV